jgi:hypothetical protein
MNHSLTQANGSTHAKIALLSVAASLVFVAIVSAVGVDRSDAPGARAHGPVVKATTTSSFATTGTAVVR